MVKAKVFKVKSLFDGLPKEEDFELVDVELPPLKDGDFLIENTYTSVDPYMRAHKERLIVGAPMFGITVGKVIESRNDKYPIDTVIAGFFGWVSHAIGNDRMTKTPMFRKYNSNLSSSYALGILGLTGFTAYFGLLDICNPQPGETVFVNAAAGATGSTVGQIAKLKGCHVVGCAGSDDKVEYLKQIGFDGFFNYKTVDNLSCKLKELCPKGIDCFFDNVGGSMYDVAMNQMNVKGRIALCGSISAYNDKEKSTGPYIHYFAIGKELKVQGFITPSFLSRFDKAEDDISKWINENKIKVNEHVVNGFENMPKAFIGLFSGNNIGKTVVKV